MSQVLNDVADLAVQWKRQVFRSWGRSKREQGFLWAIGHSVINGGPVCILTTPPAQPMEWEQMARSNGTLANIERTANTITGTLFGHPWVVVIDTL